MRHVERLTAVADTVARILAHGGGQLRLAAPLGLGKPNVLLNALYAAVVADPRQSLHVFTALSLLSTIPPTSGPVGIAREDQARPSMPARALACHESAR